MKKIVAGALSALIVANMSLPLVSASESNTKEWNFSNQEEYILSNKLEIETQNSFAQLKEKNNNYQLKLDTENKTDEDTGSISVVQEDGKSVYEITGMKAVK